MRQRTRRPTIPALLTVVALLSLVATGGCEKSSTSESAGTQPSYNPTPGPPAASVSPTPPTIASLVPSATDLLLAAGLGSHLVAVSNYDRDNPAAKPFPTAGDYSTTDWERLSSLKPNVLLLFASQSSVPQGMTDRAAALKIRLVNLKVETVADVSAAITLLGELTEEPAKAAVYRERLEARLGAVKASAQRRAAVRALLVVGDEGSTVVGHGTFLDELLTLAGGANACPVKDKRYPTLDGEAIAAIKPQVTIHLLPNATAAQVAAAQRTAGPRAAFLTDWYILQPGSHLPDIAEALARILEAVK